MEWYIYVGLIVAGFVAGFINTVAGSGSLITLPMLMFAGLDANTANATNRVGILLQSLVGVGSFKQQKVFEYKEAVWLSVPAVIGSILGAKLAIDIDEVFMRQIIGGLLVAMFFLILLKPNAWVKEQAGLVKAKPTVWQVIIFFLIGLYGGFIQAGVGFFLLAGLVLGAGFDLVKANAIKVFIVLIYTAFALGIFIWNDMIDWQAGLVLAVGNMAGAWVAARVAVKMGAKFIRNILLAIILVSASKLLGLW